MAAKGSVFVLGGGSAGQSAARYLARKGWQVTVAESTKLGGTCIWRGCIPKKALYMSARAIRQVERAGQFGVNCGEPSIDWQGVLAWKWHAQETFAGDQAGIAERAGIEVVKGVGAFSSPDQVEVDGVQYAADQFIVATGSEPVLLPDLPGADLVETSEDALRWPELPRSLVIVGGGFIALELAAIFATFGVKITVIARRDRILDMLDAELASIAARQVGALGTEFVTGANYVGAKGEPGSLVAMVDTANGRREIPAEKVLLAVGRRPSIADIGLENAGVQMERGHVAHDAALRTDNPKIWVCGDASGGMMHTPVANMEGYLVACSIDSGVPADVDTSAVPFTTFTVPQLATVGISEEQAQAQGLDVDVHRSGFEPLGEAIIDDERSGFAKLVVDKATGRILGAQMAGPTAADCIYSAAVAIRAGFTAQQLADTIAVHPSFAEAFFYAAW